MVREELMIKEIEGICERIWKDEMSVGYEVGTLIQKLYVILQERMKTGSGESSTADFNLVKSISMLIEGMECKDYFCVADILYYQMIPYLKNE